MSSNNASWLGGGHGGSHGHHHGGGYSSQTWKKLFGYVEVVTPDEGNNPVFEIDSKDVRDAIKLTNLDWEKCAPCDGDEKDAALDGLIWLTIKPHQVNWRKSTRQAATCLFNASKDYMGHMFGMSLDNDDREWYCNYDGKVSSHGCEAQWSITVTHQLVQPYGLKVRRVCVTPGAHRYAEQKEWIKALGANPFYVVDGNTTNLEALSRMGIDPTSAAGQNLLSAWAFECSPIALRPAIQMSQFQTTEIRGHSGAASYGGPRRRPEAVQMSIQLGRDFEVKYKAEPNLDPYNEYAAQAPILRTIKAPVAENAKRTVDDIIRTTLRPVVNHTQHWGGHRPMPGGGTSAGLYYYKGVRYATRELKEAAEQRDQVISSRPPANFSPDCPICKGSLTVIYTGQPLEPRCVRCNNVVRRTGTVPLVPASAGSLASMGVIPSSRPRPQLTTPSQGSLYPPDADDDWGGWID